MDEIRFGNIFPVFYMYYDNHDVATAVVSNGGKGPITDVTVTLNMKQYMDSPMVCARIPKLEAGQKADVKLTALFTNRILEITEGTRVSADIGLSYTENGQEVQASRSETVYILDRNAMSWFDDRCAAAFVTAKDPAILSFAKNVVGSIKTEMNPSIDGNLQTALAVHDALDLQGVSYVIDPKSAYTAKSKDGAVIDFLQFPRQTLEYGAGDCDDLSILYAALLESVGVETAFITVPGHIFAAFALAAGPDEALRQFSQPDDLILRDGKAWVPVEVTARTDGFLSAWQTGAKEWRENLPAGQSGFLPVHEAWKDFEPVFLPGTAAVAPPEKEKLLSIFRSEMERHIDREIRPEVARLQEEIRKSQNAPRMVNALGVLYARYGLHDKAETEFAKNADRGYMPSLLNLGNIRYMKKDMGAAQGYYERAYKADPRNPQAILGYARVNHDAENYGLVKNLYAELKALDSALAERFSYLGLRGEEAARAADILRAKEQMVWSE